MLLYTSQPLHLGEATDSGQWAEGKSEAVPSEPKCKEQVWVLPLFFCHTTGHAELPLPGIEPVPPAMEVQSPNQGTIKKSYVWVLCKLSSAVITGKAPGGGTSFSLDDTVTLWSRACLPHPLYPPLVWKHEWEISICCVNPLRFQSLSVTATYVKYFLEQDIYW